MKPSRIDALDERLGTLQRTIECFREEHTDVRRRLLVLEATVDGDAERDVDPIHSEDESSLPASATSPRQPTPSTRVGDPDAEASDAEVAAAIRAVESDVDEEAVGEGEEEILVT